MATAPDPQAARLALLHRRTRILTPLLALEQISSLLLEQSVDDQVRADLNLIHAKVRLLMVEIDGFLTSSPTGTPSEEIRTEIDFRLRSRLGDVLLCANPMLEDRVTIPGSSLANDLESLCDYARQSLRLGENLVRFLAGEEDEGERPIDWPEMAKTLATPAAPCNPGHLLVVDDANPLRDLLVRRLQALGHRVSVANNADDAWKLLPADVELILLELHLLGRNGLQLLHEIRQNSGTRLLPVLIVSSDDPIARVRCIEWGADDFLPKPPSSPLLQARVRACLEAYRARHRLRRLLHDTFPAPIAAQLEKGDRPNSKPIDDLAILFTDIKGFTAYSEANRTTPEKVVDVLAKLFDEWDEITRKHHVQKIKTTGDGYMAASGLFDDVGNRVRNCVACGLEMIQATTKLSPTDQPWKLRVGVNVGDVVSGMLGKTHYLYDVWGDAVNTASRIESNGRPNCVNLSSRAYQRVIDDYPGADHSHVSAKGKENEIIIYHIDADLVAALASSRRGTTR